MSIKRKIWALPVISACIFGLGLAASAYLSTNALSSIKSTEMVDYPSLDASKAMIQDVESVTVALRDTVAEGDKARVAQVEDLAKKVKVNIGKWSEIPKQKEAGDRLLKEFNDYYSPALTSAKIMLEIEQGDPQEAVIKMQKALEVLTKDLADNQKQAQEQFKAGISKSEASVRSALWVSIAIAVVVILALVAVAYFVVKTIWKELGGEPEYARQIAKAVAQGDLSLEIKVEDKDNDSLLAALKEMQHRLETIVSDIKMSAETVKVASDEIATGNADLASRTEMQASTLDQTARAMETLTGAVKKNASNANEANELVMSASGIASKGGEVVGQVVTTMGEINDSAKKIVDIIGVIDGIAFQTNILALNAAVEAARAGEQGRGFAVVATEVRNLAHRSAAAAKEIKGLIGASVSKVGIGTALVDQAGATMSQIVASVQKVANIMGDITEASYAQSDGIESIGRSVTSMDEMTMQNSALVEEAAAAAESLQEQAEQLNQSLKVFKLHQ